MYSKRNLLRRQKACEFELVTEVIKMGLFFYLLGKVAVTNKQPHTLVIFGAEFPSALDDVFMPFKLRKPGNTTRN